MPFIGVKALQRHHCRPVATEIDQLPARVVWFSVQSAYIFLAILS